MLRRECDLIPLLGKPGEFLVGAEVLRRQIHRFLPARDPVRKRPVDILERLLRGCPRVALGSVPDPVKGPPRLDLLLRFVAQERVFEG